MITARAYENMLRERLKKREQEHMSDAISEFYRKLLEMVKQCEREHPVDAYHPAPPDAPPPAELLTGQDRRDIILALKYMQSNGCVGSDCVTRCKELIKKVSEET